MVGIIAVVCLNCGARDGELHSYECVRDRMLLEYGVRVLPPENPDNTSDQPTYVEARGPDRD